jgi:uncharacterized OB-fold protein
MNERDWTRGGDGVHLQSCPSCGHVWAFERDFCPACGHAEPQVQAISGQGVVHATTLVHRAPDDAFRAIAPYRLVLVELDAGVRLMGHGQPDLAIGQRVVCQVRDIAGRKVPYFLESK